MSIEIWNTLQATVSGSTVNLTWTNKDPGFPPVTAFAVQRKLFGRGDDAWVTVSSGISPVSSTGAFAYSEAPGLNDWAYRVVATVTQGGVDLAGTSLFSNQVNVTTEATTGEVTLAVGSKPSSGAGGGLPGYVEIDLGFNIAGSAVDVKLWTVWRAMGSGAFRPVGHLDEFEQGGSVAWNENIPYGSGSVSYYVVAHLPSATPPYNASVLSQSNTVTLTV
jgi:hypothetical protein